jgi:hypothetical protein
VDVLDRMDRRAAEKSKRTTTNIIIEYLTINFILIIKLPSIKIKKYYMTPILFLNIYYHTTTIKM